MTPPETLILVTLLLRPDHSRRLRLAPLLPRVSLHEAQGPSAGPAGAARHAAGRHHPAADLQRDVRRRSADRGRLPDRLPARRSKSRCSTTRPTRRASIAELAVRRCGAQGIDIKYIHRDRPHRLQGRRARGRPAGRRAASSSRSSTPTSSRRPTSCTALMPPLRRPEGRHGAGALGPHQPGLLAAHEDPGDPARRPLRPRARRPQPRGPLLQFQRHGRHLARAPRSTTPAAGSTTRSPRISTCATARSCAAGSSSSCPTSSRRPKCRSR